MRDTFAVFFSVALSLALATRLAHASGSSTPPQAKVTSAAPVDRDLRSKIPISTDFEFAYIDKTGKSVINGPFARASGFGHGVAAVCEKPYEWRNGHWTAPVDISGGQYNRIIDTKGQTVDNKQLESIEPFKDQYTIAQVRNGINLSFVLVDGHGATMPIAKCLQATNYAEGLFAVKNGMPPGREQADGFGYMDKAGKLVIPYRYAIAGPFSDGLAVVGLENLAGRTPLKPGKERHLYAHYYITKSGVKIIPGPFQEAREFKSGLGAVCLADKWGFIDKTGKQAIPCQYDWVGEFSGQLAPVEKNGMVGFIDKAGKVAIPFKFKNAGSFGEGLAPATIDGAHWGFIDSTGAFKIEPAFCSAHPFSDGLALVCIKPRTDIGTHPQEAEYFFKTAYQLREDGAINDALRYCDVAIKVAPQSAWGNKAAHLKLVALPDHLIKENLLQLLQRGTVSAERRDFDLAAKLFKECLKEDPAFLQASGSLAYVLISQQKYDEALILLTKTLKEDPSYARGYLRLAQVYEAQGKMQEAQTTLNKAQNLAPDDLLIQVYILTQTPK